MLLSKITLAITSEFFLLSVFDFNLHLFSTANNQDRCSQQAKHGIGNGILERWFYDSESQSCANLEYHGLQGNENNFLSKEECEMACYGNRFFKNMRSYI